MSFDPQSVLDIAHAEVGYLEKKSNSNLYDKTANAGSGNYTKYNKEMHDIYPAVMDFPAAWCDAFVDWCFYKAYGVANAKGILAGNFDDYTVQSAQLYKNKGAFDQNPKVGDQVFFKGSAGINHTGLVYKVTSSAIYTIEGNTSNKVAYREYPRNSSRIAGYGHPLYGASTSQTEQLQSPVTSDIEKLAREVIDGKYGDGEERRAALGSKYSAVRMRVNQLLGKAVPTRYSTGTYVTSVNLNVRTGAGTNYRKKAKSELTADGQKHSTADGTLKYGTPVTVTQVKTVGIDVWGLIPSGWICLEYQGKKYANKVS